MEYKYKAQEWENSDNPTVRDAWQDVWERVRAERIGGAGLDWQYSDDAWLVAAEFAERILGEDNVVDSDGEQTAECEKLMDDCLAEIGRLL